MSLKLTIEAADLAGLKYRVRQLASELDVTAPPPPDDPIIRPTVEADKPERKVAPKRKRKRKTRRRKAAEVKSVEIKETFDVEPLAPGAIEVINHEPEPVEPKSGKGRAYIVKTYDDKLPETEPVIAGFADNGKVEGRTDVTSVQVVEDKWPEPAQEPVNPNTVFSNLVKLSAKRARSLLTAHGLKKFGQAKGEVLEALVKDAQDILESRA